MTVDFIKSFSGILPDNAIKIPDLNDYLVPGDNLYIHPSTGVITSPLVMTDLDVANYWSNTIFTSQDVDDYTAVRPFARARLSYVANTARDFFQAIQFSPSRICDFATGECILPPILRQLFADSSIVVTEASSDLAENANELGFKSYHTYLGRGDLNIDYFDFASICWTLCNCINPFSVLQDVSSSLNVGGYLIVAESSRIMVPFKKSLSDFLSKVHPADIHPYYFSAHSLSLLGYLVGLKPVSYNRFYDSDVLTVIFQKLDDSHSFDFDNFPRDSSNDILKFFDKYIDYSRFFDNLNLSQAKRA